jgi:sugar phosphate isomerase/epimerase
MFISIRECMLPGNFGTIKAGLDALGIDAVELEYFRDRSVYAVDNPDNEKVVIADDAAIAAYGKKCADLGIRVAALLLHNNFGAQDLDAELDWVIAAARTTAKLGGKAMRIDAKMIEGSLEERTDHFAMCMNKILDATSDTGLQMGIENHGRLGNEQDFQDLVINKVNSSRLGVTADTANYYWYGYPLSQVKSIIEHFAGKIKHTHVKNINYPADKREIQREVGWEYGTYASTLRDGDLDMKWLVGVLAKAGYNYDLCIENEGLGHFDPEGRKKALIDDVNCLREALREVK